MTPEDAVPRPQGPPPAPVTPLTLPAGSAFGLQPLGTPRVDYDKPADRGSWTVAGGKGGQSSALWENARMVTQSMHLKRDEAAKKRNEEELMIREFIGDEARPHCEMTQEQKTSFATYKGCINQIKGISKGKGKLHNSMLRFQQNITEESDTAEDDIRDDLKKAAFKAKFPGFEKTEISGVTMHWHEMEGVFHENVEGPKFHIKGMQSFMENARPQGQQIYTRPITVEWES